MQVGCGVYAHTVRRKRYLYFWHYETRGASRVQVKEYVGAAGSTRARAEAARRCDAYYARVLEDLERLRAGSVAAIRAAAGP